MPEFLPDEFYMDWPSKVENSRKALLSEKKRLPVNEGMPIRVTINASTSCNLNCTMCKYHGQSEIDAESLPLEDFKMVAEQLFPLCKELHPSTTGEPLVLSYFKKILLMLREYGVKLNLTTNGMLLTGELAAQIVPLLRDAKISFDGARKETFEKIRRGARFEIVVENTGMLVAARNAYVAKHTGQNHFYKPTITLQTVLMRDNIEELPDIVHIAHSLGADRVKAFNLVVTSPPFLNQSLLFHQELANEYLKRGREQAERYGLKTKYQEPFDMGRDVFHPAPQDRTGKPRACEFLWRQINIEPNGDVKACCHLESPVMGNIYEDPVTEIWNNEKYQEMRKKLDEDPVDACCRHCPMQSPSVINFRSFIRIDEPIVF
jgi:radical SAM protein with 4Fe4S-binding SPASM domain